MLRLLIVDDEEIICNAIAKMIDFESLGYKLIGTAKNGIEAFDMICDNYPDVVLTDIKMPGLNGLELIEKALHLDQGIDFIILSGFGEFEMAQKAIQFGVKNYILKPTDKNELNDTLSAIRNQRLERERTAKQNESRLMENLYYPIQSCFLIESLDSLQNFNNSYNKYSRLLSLPEKGITTCICSFVEKSSVLQLVNDAKQILKELKLSLAFPIISIQGSLVFLLSTKELTLQNQLKQRIEALLYNTQSVSFNVHFIHAARTYDVFEKVIYKLSRYNRIYILDSENHATEVRNNLTTPWKIREIGSEIKKCNTESEINNLLHSVITPDIPLNTSKNTALGIFMYLDTADNQFELDLATHFFKRLYALSNSEEIIQLLQMTILSRTSLKESKDLTPKNLISELKEYVTTHLNSESISLKWIAENHLYVSVGYLSKQFVKEEGIRFSEYLNQVRMEEAIKLLNLYNNASIKTIAKQVGFGNNPHYFSQVFRKYTGKTPTEYIESMN